jgi:hypothetical protein
MKLQDIKSKKSIVEQQQQESGLNIYSPSMIKNALWQLEWDATKLKQRLYKLQHARKTNPQEWEKNDYDTVYANYHAQLKALQDKIQHLKAQDRITYDERAVEDFWLVLKRECSDYLAACSQAQKWLYRGIKNEHRPAFLAKTRENRPPMDSNPLLMKCFDQALKTLGFSARRENSIFAISDRDKSLDFGDVYVIFPRNGFDFTYTNEREIILDELDQVLSNKHIESGMQAVKQAMTSQPDKWPILTPNATPEILWFTVQRHRESLLSQGFPQNLVDDISDPQYISQKYQPQQTNLHVALTGGQEVYVRGEYYALRWKWYWESINSWMYEIQKAPISEQTAHDGNAASPTQVIPTELDKWHAAAGRMQERIHTLMRQGDHAQELKTRKALQNFREKIGTPNIEQMPLASKLLTEIQQKCSDILEICHDTGRFLYHGSKHLGEFTYLAHSQPRQRPKDSDPATSRVFNYGLEKLGFTATRDNSLFVTSDRTLASDYGELYVVLPCTGQYDFTYTSRKDDVLTKYNLPDMMDNKIQMLFTAWQKIPYDVQKEIIVYPEILKTAQDLIHWLVEHENSLGTISKIQKLTGLSAKWQDYVDLPALRYIYNPRQDNLADAMSSGREIYLKGKFYLLKVDPWKNGIDWWPILQSWIKKT